MKKILLLCFVLGMFYSAQAQWSNKSFTHDGLTRQYRVYKPAIYNPAVPASLIIGLHGLGDNMTNFSGLGFSYIGDTANIIFIVPQAISDAFAGTAWNSGAGFMSYYPNATVNDVGFLNALIDTARANYAINPARVYIVGFSMGGFMTERMALQSNSQIAAFASFSGTIGSGITQFNPGRSVPIAHFHGTADGTVAFTGNSYGIDADSLVRFWVLNNGCNQVPDSMTYPDLAGDSITIDRFIYQNTPGNPEVWFFRMNGADHTVLYQPTNDFTQIMEAWMFLRKYSNPTAGTESAISQSDISIFPNPASDFVNIMLPYSTVPFTIEIYTLQGRLIKQENAVSGMHYLSLEDFPSAMYLIRISGNNVNITKQIAKQ